MRSKGVEAFFESLNPNDGKPFGAKPNRKTILARIPVDPPDELMLRSLLLRFLITVIHLFPRQLKAYLHDV